MLTTPTTNAQTILETEDAMALFLACAEMFEDIPIATDYLQTQLAHLQYNELQPADTMHEQLQLGLNVQADMLAGFTPIHGFFPAFIDWPLPEPEEDTHNVWDAFRGTYSEYINYSNAVEMDLEPSTAISTNFYEMTLAFKAAGVNVNIQPNIIVLPEEKTFMGFLLSNFFKNPTQKAGKQKLAELFA